MADTLSGPASDGPPSDAPPEKAGIVALLAPLSVQQLQDLLVEAAVLHKEAVLAQDVPSLLLDNERVPQAGELRVLGWWRRGRGAERPAAAPTPEPR